MCGHVFAMEVPVKMKHLIALLLGLCLPLQAADPFFSFAMESSVFDQTTFPVVARHFTSGDYLGWKALRRIPALESVIPTSHQFQFSYDVGGVQTSVRNCSPGAPGWIYYHWGVSGKTPANEMTDPATAVSRAAAIAHAGSCRRFGLVPEGNFFGASGCSAATGGAPFQKIDWSVVDAVDITVSGLLRDSCPGDSRVETYVNATKSIAGFIRGRNRNIIITAHFSFDETAPMTMVAAAQALKSSVDGFQLAYPMNGSRKRKYCSASNLEMVLSGLRQR